MNFDLLQAFQTAVNRHGLRYGNARIQTAHRDDIGACLLKGYAGLPDAYSRRAFFASPPKTEGSSTSSPLVSMIVPAFNVEGTVPASIESLLAQDYPNFEVICIDDGSTDATAGILDGFAEKDSRVHVVHKSNGGYGSAINTGIDSAHGEWIGILEADDVCKPDMLSRLVAEGSRHNADMVKADWYLWRQGNGDVRPAGKILRSWCGHFLSRKERLALCRVSPAIWSALYRRSFLDGNSIRCLETPGAAFQDTSFNIKAILSADRLVAVKDAFVSYRQDNPQSSVRSRVAAMSIIREYSAMDEYLKCRPDIAEWAAGCVRELEYSAYLWNLKRIAPGLRNGFVDAARERLSDYGLFASPVELLRKIDGKVARRERRSHRQLSLHVNSRRAELLFRGRTVFCLSY